jgi:hypothetical protein
VVAEQHAWRVLVIQLWTHDTGPIADALRRDGIDAAIASVDFEAALDAALCHATYDVAIYIDTPGLPMSKVRECIARNQRTIPVVKAGELATLGPRLRDILKRN